MSITRTALAILGLLAVFGATAPTSLSAQSDVDSLKIVSSAGADNTYAQGDTIKVTVWFDTTTDVAGSDVNLYLSIGGSTRTAVSNARQGRSGTASGKDWYEYWYYVQRGDFDADGITTDSLGSFDVVDFVTEVPLNPDLTGHKITNAAAHKVNGLQGVPTVADVVIASDPGTDSTYVRRDPIEIGVVFSENVDVTGMPQLGLTVGAATRQASYVSGTGGDSLTFQYRVTSADADSDGIGISSSALTLNGGTINKAGSTVTAHLPLGDQAIANAAAHKVDGSQGPPSNVDSLKIVSSAGADNTYEQGDTIKVTIWFDTNTDIVGSTLALYLKIGTETRTARWDPSGGYGRNGIASGKDWFEYWYFVRRGDFDADGITTDSLRTRDLADFDTEVFLDLDLTSHKITNAAAHKVDARIAAVSGVAISSSPSADSTYKRGETIDVGVKFNVNVAVTGTPQLALTIGTATRQARYVSGTGGDSLTFRYDVAHDDADANGISIGASALTLNGGTINRTSNNGSAANLGLGSHAVTNVAAHKVNGSQGPPVVADVAIASDAGADSKYATNDTIDIAVVFNENVDVTGTPQLALTIGATTRQANYASGTGTDSLTFRYIVVAQDEDVDGISIGRSALTLNGGTIKKAGDATVDAALSTANHTVTNAVSHRVNVVVPSVSDVSIVSTPVAADSTYGRPEQIQVTVTFDQNIDMAGTAPYLNLTIGAQTRRADRCATLDAGARFCYTVVQADTDADGISIGAGALVLPSGGTIRNRGTVVNANLSLESHAISNAPAHKVTGSLLTPNVSRMWVHTVPGPGPDQTYSEGNVIRIRVQFSTGIAYTNIADMRVNMQIGDSTRQAVAGILLANNTYEFQYVVTRADVDADGISVAADGLVSVGNPITRSGGTEKVDLSLGTNAFVNDANHKVDGLQGVPTVADVAIASDPGTDSTYVRFDLIEIGVVFSENVDVTGVPQLALTVGAATRQANYVSGTGGDSLTFQYRVATADADSDGIGISSSALTRNGGTIRKAGSARPAHLPLGSQAIANAAAHKVDGSQGPPGVAGVAIASNAGSDDTYANNDTIEVAVTFNENVDVTGTPQLALTIGTATKQASYVSGTGGDSLTFRYIVASGDIDEDGLSVGASALALNGGTIRRAGGTANAWLGLSGYVVTNAAAHKVLALQGVAHVRGTSIVSDAGTDSIYALGDTIEVALTFTENVDVTGTPQLALEIGDSTRQANFVSGGGFTELRFRYITVASDTDSDGISYSSSALTLNGGTIKRAGATADAYLGLRTFVVANDAAHKVLPTSNKVTDLLVNSAGNDSTFVRGDTIKVTIVFRDNVVVTGGPRVRVYLGATDRWANYHSGSGTNRLEFRYVVQAGIEDKNGLAIHSNDPQLNGGTIQDENDIDVSPMLPASAQIINGPAWKVAGSARVTSVSLGSPPTGDVFERGDTIKVTMVYSDSVDVTGVPTAWLKLTSATHRPALYASGTGTDTLEFRYVVEAADNDSDGLSLYGNAIQLTGNSTIREAGTTTAAFHDTPWPYTGPDAIANSAGHKVAGAVRVARMTLGSPPTGDTFERGDTIKVTLEYTDSVDVTGVPTVWIRIGSQPFNAATYLSGSGTSSLEFGYVVQSGDADADGVSLNGNALQWTGGSTIREAGTSTNTFSNTPWRGPGSGGLAISNSAGHKVAGGTFTASAVSGVAISSSPSSGDTYGLSERIEVEVSFVRPVAVTGTPQLALGIGSQTRQADYASGTGTKTLTFGYAVTASDADSDGLSIGASALALNGGTIRDSRDGTTAASLGLGTSAISNSAAHKVDGVQGPPGVTGMTLSTPDVGDTFERGERIEVTVTFNKSVDVTGTPQVALGIGSTTKQAAYASGTGTATLVFGYEVVSADADADGLSIGASALGLNGGTIREAGGATDAVLGLGSHAVTNSGGHKVAGVRSRRLR